jgi:signal peptidase I
LDSPEEEAEGRVQSQSVSAQSVSGAETAVSAPSGGLDASAEDPPLDAKNHRQEFKREVIDFVKLVVWFLVIFLALRTYVIEAYEVQGPSMIPTLETNERILVLKLPHKLSQLSLFSGFEAISAGDVIVFNSPDNKDKRYVKRVIAVGPADAKGKTVSATSDDAEEVDASTLVNVVYDRGAVYVNNERIEEEYLSTEARHTSDKQDIDIGPGQLYVLGDNRPVSKDSRSFRAIEDDTIIGRAVLRFWPPSKISLVR